MSASDASPPAGDAGPSPEDTVMAAHDEEDLVIADVSRDDAWLVVPVSEAPDLTDWR
jgi:hypothetical protein